MNAEERLNQLKLRIIKRSVSDDEVERELNELLDAFGDAPGHANYRGKIRSAIEQAKNYFQTPEVGPDADRLRQLLIQDLTAAAFIADRMQRSSR